MPLILAEDIPNGSWGGPVNAGTNQVWQCRQGTVYLTTNAGAGPNDGIKLPAGAGMPISSGLNVYYRREKSTSLIAYEQV